MKQTRLKRWILAGSLWLGVCAMHSTAHAQQPDSNRAELVERRAPTFERERARPESYGAMLIKMMLGVLLITVLAYVTIRYGLKRFLPGAQQSEAMQVLLRQPLEPKRSLLVVRVASRYLLLASSESGISLLTELTEEDAAQMLGEEIQGSAKKAIPREFSLELDEPMTPPAS